MDGKIARIKELVQILNEAGKAYYSQEKEIMTNFEYDRLYDELGALEKETGYMLSDSPTIHVGYEALSQLPKERHEQPMLSLDKTKEISVLRDWIGKETGLLSWKLDGLTVVITYENGQLQKAVTRGNGEIGEVITNNAKVFKNLPITIPYKEQLVIRGEAVITYSDFEKINDSIENPDQKYKNPRNLCSGSVRQLDNRIAAQRNVKLFAFQLVKADGVDFHNSRSEQMEWLKMQGFQTVAYKTVTEDNLAETVEWFEKSIEASNEPSDGLVLTFNDIAYGESLGKTSKFPRNSLAFKWTDETKETKLLEIEWSPSRTGLINPIAIFEPVELEGTRVSRASLHNISIMEMLELGIGDTVVVYKANMIIPQVAENLTKSGVKNIPETCPVCMGRTEIRQQNDIKSLYCTNAMCQAKHIKSFVHFVSRDAMNIEGLSEATLEKFIQRGMLKQFKDLYYLETHKEEITGMEGFGKRSYENLINAIERSRKTTLSKLIYSLGIGNIGLSTAKLICREFDDDVQRIVNADRETLQQIPGIGSVIADIFAVFFENETNQETFFELLKELNTKTPQTTAQNNVLDGKTFVITGSVNHFANRNDLKDFIENMGGKTTSSVTSNTDYLINNDSGSSSSKNKTAQKLGVSIITEEAFLQLAQKADLL